MGSVNDKRRRAAVRVDNAEVQALIARARERIFKGGAAPEGTKIDNLLKDKSLQPLRVSSAAARTDDIPG